MAAALPPLLVTLVWAGVLLLPTATHGAVVQPQTLPFYWNLGQMERTLQFDWPLSSPKAALLAQTLERLLKAERWQEWDRETKTEAAALAQLLLHLWGSSHLAPEVNMEEAVVLGPKAQAKEEASDSKQALLRFLMNQLVAKMSKTRITPTSVWAELWPLHRRRLRLDLGPGFAPTSQGIALLHLKHLEASGAKGRAQLQRELLARVMGSPST